MITAVLCFVAPWTRVKKTVGKLSGEPPSRELVYWKIGVSKPLIQFATNV